MDQSPFVSAVRNLKQCFDRATECLDEADSEFTPVEGTFTVAQQVAHTAQTVDWFVEGAFAPDGFDLDFAAHETAVRKVTSLKEARAWLDRAVENAIVLFESKTPEEMAAPIAAGPILGGAPRSAIVAGLTDHTAHHRGALAVYARLRGKQPSMPYG